MIIYFKEESRADILALEKESEGLLDIPIKGHSMICQAKRTSSRLSITWPTWLIVWSVRLVLAGSSSRSKAERLVFIFLPMPSSCVVIRTESGPNF